MGFFRRIAGVLGFGKDEPPRESNEEEDDTHADHHTHHHHNNHHHHNHQQQHHQQHQQHHRGEEQQQQQQRRQGFSVKVPVVVERAPPVPIITPCKPGEGGVQGLRWYARRLQMDEDGDVANEFLNEAIPEVVEMSSSADARRPLPKFEVKQSTRPDRVRKQMIFVDGKIGVSFLGKLQWV